MRFWKRRASTGPAEALELMRVTLPNRPSGASYLDLGEQLLRIRPERPLTISGCMRIGTGRPGCILETHKAERRAVARQLRARMGIGLGGEAPRPEMMAAVSPRVAGTRYMRWGLLSLWIGKPSGALIPVIPVIPSAALKT